MSNSDQFSPRHLDGDGLLKQSAGANPIARPDEVAGDLPEIISGTNPLVTAANPILNLIPQLRATAQHPDPAGLRDYLVDQIKAFELRARQAGIGNETVIGARYCLCTALDETAAQTPWGGSGSWSRHSLLVTFHNETSGGEKFFQLLSKLAQNPQQHYDLLELMYFCLAMGFEGRFRVSDNGRTQLDTLKQRLVGILATAKGETQRPLSQHWKGEAPKKQRAWLYLPVWVLACIVGVVAALIYLWATFGLADLSDDLFASINKLRMPHVVLEAPPPPPRPTPPRLAKFLEEEIRQGLVQVRDGPDRSVVTLVGDGLFGSASAVVLDRYIPVIARIGDAMNSVPGNVVVSGYTDNTSIRSLLFPSNFELSQARADSVKRLLDAKLTAPGRTKAMGRGAEDPIAPNDTPVNRAKNRRVEITLMLAADNRDR
ncbi:MAG: DotU family type VI secretion system protein [Burkholderiaceae bacterium]|nr:DotU family type VI secretion system protein [Burkholderiaceae bacterium]